jgi:para-nitrobenzyl esterase
MILSRNKLIIIFIFMFFQNYLYSQRYLVPVFDNIKKTYDIKYGSAMNENGNTEDLFLDLYEPERDTLISRPLIIMIHGGAFITGDKSHKGMVKLCENFAKRGYVVTSINYRLGKKISPSVIMEAMYDARAAVRFFKKYASMYKIDTTRIAIGGGSAGAYTALNVAYIDKESELLKTAKLKDVEGSSGNAGFNSKVNACIDLWGALINTDAMNSKEEPPLLIIHGTNDMLVNFKNAMALDEQAKRINLYLEFYPLEKEPHAPWNKGQFIDEKMTKFLYKVLIENRGRMVK